MISSITNYVKDAVNNGIDYAFEAGPHDDRHQNASLYAGGFLGLGAGYLDWVLEDEGENFLEETVEGIEDPVVSSYSEIAIDTLEDKLGSENFFALGQGIETAGELTSESLGYLDEAADWVEEIYGPEAV